MDNKSIIMNFCDEFWKNRHFKIVDQLFSDHVTIHSPFNDVYGRVTMLDIADKWFTAFPDLTFKWEDFISDQDKVVCRWRAEGTHMGSLFDTSPTHREVSFSGVTTFQLQNGKVTHYWGLVDMHAILRQLEGFSHIAEVVE